MNETLKAWERLKKGIDTNVWECGYWDDIELIEKELKDKEKKDKALEIIKNKNVFVWGFIHRKEEIKHFEQTYDYYKTHYGYFHSGYKFELLTEEEYDLLKEVLL